MRVYKERSKTKTTLTVVYNPQVPGEEEDGLLRELQSVTDIFFIFPKEETLKKRLRKFSNLYGATYYGIQEGSETESDLVYEALTYGKELGGGYLGYFIIPDNIKLSKESLSDINRLGSSLIETSIWKSHRSTLQEFRSIFEIPDTWWSKFWRYLKIDPRNEISRMFESHHTEDPVMFLREITLDRLEAYFKDNKIYRESFKESEIGTFLSSAIERICPETKINVRIRDAKT